MSRRIWWALLALILLCGFIVAAIFIVIDNLNSDLTSTKLLIEVAKIFLQLSVIGVLGGIIKWMFDQHTSERERAAEAQAREQERVAEAKAREEERASEINEFRKEMLRRLISINAQVRQAPVLIEAAQSLKAYSEQMQVVIGAWLELSIIRHEIQTAAEVAFSSWSTIRDRFVEMERYLEYHLIDEYRHARKHLAEAHPEEVWLLIQDLSALQGFLSGDTGSDYFCLYVQNYFAARDIMRQEIWAAVGVEPSTE
jgi:hypothetical protein